MALNRATRVARGAVPHSGECTYGFVEALGLTAVSLFLVFLQGAEVGVVGGGFDGALGGVDHVFNSGAAAGHEAGNDVGFGQVFPILERHLRAHGFDLESSGIEDAAVVGAPEVIVGVGGGGVVTAHTGQVGEGFPIPTHALVWGQNGPVHAGKTFPEKRGGESGDAILGLEPGDELLATTFFTHTNEAETNKGVHLVNVATDGFGPGVALKHVGI